MQNKYKILTINPGSTSTKVALFENLECISSRTLRHNPDEIAQFKSVTDQYEFRRRAVADYLDEMNIYAGSLNAVVGRGGLMRPLRGGTYNVSKDMLEDLKSLKFGEHASNLGAIIAYELAAPQDIPAYIVNPVVVDELDEVARYSGLSHIPRKSVFHALNQKAIAGRTARSMGKKYEEVNLVVAHMGGGISVAAHQKGSVIDVNNGLEEGPFSPERSGSLPVLQLIDMCYSGEYSKAEMKKLAVGKGGLVSYTGTSDCKAVEDKALDGDKDALMLMEAMAYQVAKEIGAYSAVLKGCVDMVVLTGGLAYSSMLTGMIEERVKFIAPVVVHPGEDEMLAMAEGAYSVLAGEENALNY
jgi:butyrate kinase